MQLSAEEYLKKAILDTQERVRDFEQYSKEIHEDKELVSCFKKFAENEGHQAAEMQKILDQREKR